MLRTTSDKLLCACLPCAPGSNNLAVSQASIASTPIGAQRSESATLPPQFQQERAIAAEAAKTGDFLGGSRELMGLAPTGAQSCESTTPPSEVHQQAVGGGQFQEGQAANAGPQVESMQPFAGSMLRRSTSQLVRFEPRSNLHQSTSREDLIEQGLPARQASQVMVRQSEHDVVESIFAVWIAGFLCIFCIMLPVALGISIWVFVEYANYKDVDCDKPLQKWFLVLLCVTLFRSVGIHRCLAKCFCNWPDPSNPTPMPCLLKVYNLAVPAFGFGWNCLGLHYVATDGSGSEHPPCQEVAPGLYTSVKVYAALNVFNLLLFSLFMVGPVYVLVFLLRHGLVSNPDAAPKGTIDKIAVVPKDDPAVVESDECSICMVKYASSQKPIVKTACAHTFHKACLKTWLERFNRTCPLCRKDLSS